MFEPFDNHCLVLYNPTTLQFKCPKWNVSLYLSTAHIQGTEVVAQKTFTVTQEAVDLVFEGYGFKLHVPEDALPAEVSETRLDVQVSLSGHFQMPSDSRLISAVYWVSSPHKLMKPITVEIQHCATLTNDEQCSHLTFVHSMCSQEKLPYMFMEQDGGVFTPHSSYGILSHHHCQYPWRLVSTFGSWHIISLCIDAFYFIFGSDIVLQAMQDVYSSLNAVSGPDLEVEFETDNISLSIPEDGICLQNGWTIKPLVPPVVSFW